MTPTCQRWPRRIRDSGLWSVGHEVVRVQWPRVVPSLVILVIVRLKGTRRNSQNAETVDRKQEISCPGREPGLWGNPEAEGNEESLAVREDYPTERPLPASGPEVPVMVARSGAGSPRQQARAC